MTSDHAVRLRHVLTQLEQNQISTVDAAKAVSQLKFPAVQHRTAYQGLADDVAGDPEVPEEGSFYEVTEAYNQGRITRLQYEALAEAAAQAMKAQA